MTEMLCRCDPTAEAKCKRLRYRVKKKLNVGDATLLSAVVMNLQNLPNGGYTHLTFASDMWFGIGAEVVFREEDKIPSQQYFLQCDYLEDGLCRIYELVTEGIKNTPLDTAAEVR